MEFKQEGQEVAATRSEVSVFVVDDDESVRRSLSRLLGVAGFQVTVFDAPDRFLDAVRFARTGRCCLLLDIVMPGASGLQVVERMHRQGIDIPVIALSATDAGGHRHMAKRLGASLFFSKPVDDKALIDAIEWVTAPNQPDG
ncbi:response regulator transcription factor [Halomonas sp. 1390]|uniref:response regulator transcription factor n=1 Tax=Halomonas sp. B23F22_3 TaxID=3459516 RepID=UPI00373F1BE3